MGHFVVALAAVLLLDVGTGWTDATACRPLSSFRIDCNYCLCSSNGFQYSCSNDVCPPPDRSKFVEEDLDGGFVLLRPRKEEDDDFVLTRNMRQDENNVFYVEDELSSRKFDDLELEEDSPVEINAAEDNANPGASFNRKSSGTNQVDDVSEEEDVETPFLTFHNPVKIRQ